MGDLDASVKEYGPHVRVQGRWSNIRTEASAIKVLGLSLESDSDHYSSSAERVLTRRRASRQQALDPVS